MANRPNKLSQEHVDNYFAQRECKLLDVYVNNYTKMKYRCKCGGDSYVTWSNFKQGSRCWDCMEKSRRIDSKLAANYFEQQGCKLLDVYKNNHIKMKYQCKCDNISCISWSNFKKVGCCKKCSYEKTADRQKHSFEYIKYQFEKSGYKLLESEYNNAHQLLKYECICGNITTITYNQFEQGRRCKKCAVKSRSGKNSNWWNPDREKVNMNKLLHDKGRTALRECLIAIKKQKTNRTFDMLGYTAKEFGDRIFNHPNWHKVKDGKWSIDHIFPIDAFIKNKIYDLKIINSLDNLQPMLLQNNIDKRNKYNSQEFAEWLKEKGVPITCD